LFGYEYSGISSLRITRDTDLALEDEADDLLRAIEQELKRRLGSTVRLELKPQHLKECRELGIWIWTSDVYE